MSESPIRAILISATVFGLLNLVATTLQAAQPPSPQPTAAASETTPIEARGTARAEISELTSSVLNIDRWAIIVGISKYKHEPWNLEYAKRDADELADLLRKGTSG